MQTLDITTSLDPVINLTEKTTAQAFSDACGYPMTKIFLQDLTPYAGPVSIPVRIIEGMEDIAERGTANKSQMELI